MIDGDHADEGIYLMTENVNVQSVVTPALAQTNGSAPILQAKATKARKAKAMASVATPTPIQAEAEEATITVEQAVEVAFNYGASMAGMDGALTKALQTYRDNEAVQNDMLQALNIGYLTRKLNVSKIEATRIYNLKKYSDDPKLQDDEHRTFEQQRVMNTVRVLWHRAKQMGGIIKKSEDQVEAEVNRAKKEAEKKAHEERLIKADEIVNPKNDVDPFDALARLALTMKSLANKHSAKLTGDRGTAWRTWLASMPK
jgi:hypothetical protein